MHPGVSPTAAATNTVDSMLRHQKILEGGHCEIRALLALLEAVVAVTAAAAVCSAVLVRVNVPH